MNSKSQLRKIIKEKLENGKIDEIVDIFKNNYYNIDLRGLEVHDLVISGIDFVNMFNNGSIWTCILINNVTLSTSDFRGTTFKDTIFENLIIKNSVFIGTKFINSKFKNVTFIECDLSGASFYKSSTYNIEFTSCNLYNTGLNGENHFDKIKSINITDYTYTLLSKLSNTNISLLSKVPYLLARILFNSDIPLHSIKMGKNCRFAHLGFGTIVAGGCQIGDNVWIGPKVNIFGRHGNVPVIGNNVIIGIGSTIAANIGDNAIIGAGALVFDNIPNNSMVVGIKGEVKI